MTKNMERCLKRVQEIHPEVETEEQLRKYLGFMSDENREIFEAKWGIDKSGIFCETYKEVNKKLQLENSRHLYHKALSELDFVIFKFSFAKLFDDYEDNIALAFCYGTFIASLSGNYAHPEELPPLNATISEMKERCNKAFKVLSKLQRKVIVTKFGLEDCLWYKADTRVALFLGITTPSVSRAVDRAFIKLQDPANFSIILGK